MRDRDSKAAQVWNKIGKARIRSSWRLNGKGDRRIPAQSQMGYFRRELSLWLLLLLMAAVPILLRDQGESPGQSLFLAAAGGAYTEPHSRLSGAVVARCAEDDGR